MSATQSENTRHPSLKISGEQEANLRTLAAYLLTLPTDYPDFEMSDFVQVEDLDLRAIAHTPACGTAACAVGHGPQAGIKPVKGERWANYSERLSGLIFGSDAWEWCFAGDWHRTDNTVHGAAKRIGWLLENGLPNNHWEQRRGYDELCYNAQAAS